MAGEIYSSTTSGSSFSVSATLRLVLLTSRTTSGSSFSVSAALRRVLLTSLSTGGSSFSVAATLRRVLLTSRSTGGSRASAAATMTYGGGSPQVRMTCTGRTRRAILSVTTYGLSVKDVIQHIFSIWGRSSCSDCQDTEVQRDAIACLNHALQTLYSHAPRLDWFSRQTLTLTITGGTNSTTLAQAVQTVLGNARLSAGGVITPLAEVRNRAEFDAHNDLAYGGAAHAPANPRAYHCESLRQAAEDGVMVTLRVTPTPAADATVLLDVVQEPERYQWSDARNGTRLRVPHKYVELLLIPLALKVASRYRHFTRRESQPQIDQSFAAALEALGMTTTETPAATAEKPTTPAANARR